MTIPTKYEDVVAKLDAALWREAALREELSGSNRRLGACINQIEEQQRRLTVAEQRVGEMNNALARIHGRAEMFIDDGMHMPTPSIEAIRDIAAKAALNPAGGGKGNERN